MRRSRFWAGGLAVMVALGFPAPVSAGGGVFVIANTASNEGEPVPRGSLLSVVTEAPVALEVGKFEPWVDVSPDGLYVQASCTRHTYKLLPIVSVQPWGTGHKIDVYYPNRMGDEPFGTCDNDGDAEISVQPANGLGPLMTQPVVTVNGHPGIFSVGPFPDGEHVGPGKLTSLADCARASAFCPVQTSGQPAEMTFRLTGSEWFACKPCSQPNIFFELAPVVNGVVGTYQPQTLISLMPLSMGVEEARLLLRSDLAGGEYRLRVRNSVRPVIPAPLTVLLGPPL